MLKDRGIKAKKAELGLQDTPADLVRDIVMHKSTHASSMRLSDRLVSLTLSALLDIAACTPCSLKAIKQTFVGLNDAKSMDY